MDAALAVTAARERFLWAAALAALAGAAFLPILGHEWLNYDDDVYITANPQLRLGLSRDGIAWAFTTFHGANWFPLTWLSWMLDYELHGLDASGFLATNLLLHAACTAVLFLALSRMTGSVPRSAFVAAVFAVHPLHVESVAWAAVRKDTLSALFFLLALLAWARQGAAGPGPRTHAAVAACFVLGFLAKPVVVVLPFVLLLLDAWPLRRLGWRDRAGLRRALREKLPLFALVALACAIAFTAQRAGGAVAPIEELPLAERAANALVAYVAYLGQTLWPGGLAVFYPHPGASLPVWQVLGSAGLLLALTAGAALAWRRAPAVTVGWLWYLGTLVPAIGLVQVGSQARADRYMYLPLIGLAIAAAWGVPALLARAPQRRALAVVAALASVAALTLVTELQLRHWRDSESLFRHALAVTSRNHVAHAYLGAALLARGETAATIDHYKRALQANPNFMRAANNLAWLLATHPDPELREPDVALRVARRAARLTDYRDAAVLDTLAAAHAAAGRFEQAVGTAERALALSEAERDPALAAALRARLALYRAGRPYRDADPARP